MSAITIVWFLAGMAALVWGAEVFVRGASRLAVLMGISPLVVGLTVVAFGTSAPETAVCVQSAWAGTGDIGIGNVVGSNICNVLLILGLSALITPMLVQQRVVKLDVPIMIGVSVLMLLMALDGGIGRLDGLVLFAGSIAYVTFQIVQSRRETRAVQREYEREFGEAPAERGGWAWNVALVVAGIVLIVLGAGWLVNSATEIARALGVSELIIGLTIVAFGTSLPEVATSVVASMKGERDIAVGNIVGSNIFNILVVLGASASVAPAGIAVQEAALRFDIPIMIAVSVACLPVAFIGYTIHRWEGGLFLAYYFAYLVFLGLSASGHPLLSPYSDVMLTFVIPLTSLTLVILTVRSFRNARKKKRDA